MSLARQFFGLAPEPADGYPSGGAMLYGEEKGFEIVPVAQITSELMLALMAMQERSISAHLEAGPFSAQAERLTTPTDVEKWLAQPAVCDERGDEPGDCALWSVLRVQLRLLTKQYTFLTFHIVHDENDGLGTLMLSPLLWERK